MPTILHCLDLHPVSPKLLRLLLLAACSWCNAETPTRAFAVRPLTDRAFWPVLAPLLSQLAGGRGKINRLWRHLWCFRASSQEQINTAEEHKKGYLLFLLNRDMKGFVAVKGKQGKGKSSKRSFGRQTAHLSTASVVLYGLCGAIYQYKCDCPRKMSKCT